MGYAGNMITRRAGETNAQWKTRIALAGNVERKSDDPIVTPEASANGAYIKRFVTHVETNTKAQTAVNRGGTPLCRWTASGKLTDGQMVAIGLCIRLWHLAGLRQKLIADYGPMVAKGGGDADRRAVNEIQAREDLHRIQDYFPASYWDVFENVCRHDIPAGVAGAQLGYGNRSAEDRAHQIVAFVADVISMKENL